MITTKSYTDLEQSKKLLEILPVESADMYYKYVLPTSKRIHHIPEIGNPIDSLKWYNEGYTFSGRKKPITLNDYCIPCWSLAPLLNVLPDKIYLNNETYHLNYDKNEVKYLGYMTWDGQKCITSKANNIIDSCYEMIIKLYEQKLL